MRTLYLKQLFVITWGIISSVQIGYIQNPIMGDFIPNLIETSNLNIPCKPDIIYLERDISPILITNCVLSNDPKKQSAQKRVVLTDYEKFKYTVIVRPFILDKSKISEVTVDDDNTDKMPLAPLDPLNPDYVNMGV